MLYHSLNSISVLKQPIHLIDKCVNGFYYRKFRKLLIPASTCMTCQSKLSQSHSISTSGSASASIVPKLLQRRNKWTCQNKILEHLNNSRCSRFSSKAENIMNVFDRKSKRIQRNRIANLEEYQKYEYLKEEFGWRMADRISDVKRKFEVAVDVGCGRGYIGRHCYSDMVGTLYQMDMADKLLEQIEPNTEIDTVNIVGDEEFFPFKEQSLDLVVSSLNLHWVNDLPGTFLQIFKALKNDGCFMGAMFGGDTLFELRCSLQLAETEREGGFAPHISPFTSVQDLGNLLNRAGYVMLTIDIDEIVVNYPTMFELMQDLKGMGENNCQWSRRLLLPRDTQMTAASIYKEMYGSKDEESVPASFQVICFIAWKPDASQAKAAKRGSGQVSIKDVHKLDQLTKQVKEMQKEIKGSALDNTIDKLNKDLDKLKQTVKDDREKDK